MEDKVKELENEIKFLKMENDILKLKLQIKEQQSKEIQYVPVPYYPSEPQPLRPYYSWGNKPSYWDEPLKVIC